MLARLLDRSRLVLELFRELRRMTAAPVAMPLDARFARHVQPARFARHVQPARGFMQTPQHLHVSERATGGDENLPDGIARSHMGRTRERDQPWHS